MQEALRTVAVWSGVMFLLAMSSANAQFLGHNFRGDYGLQSATQPPIADQVAYLWNLAYTRWPTRDELELSLEFVTQQLEMLRDHEEPVLQAMTNYCQNLLASNEFLYLQ